VLVDLGETRKFLRNYSWKKGGILRIGFAPSFTCNSQSWNRVTFGDPPWPEHKWPDPKLDPNYSIDLVCEFNELRIFGFYFSRSGNNTSGLRPLRKETAFQRKETIKISALPSVSPGYEHIPVHAEDPNLLYSQFSLIHKELFIRNSRQKVKWW